jgi:hypothetical protein
MNNYFNSLSGWFLRQNSLRLFILFCLAGLQLKVASSTGSINIFAVIELIGILSVISWIYSVGIKSRQLLIKNGADLKGEGIFNLIFGIAIIATVLMHYLAKEQILLDKNFDTLNYKLVYIQPWPLAMVKFLSIGLLAVQSAKHLVSAELRRNALLKEYLGTLSGFIFSWIGVWYIQPRIKKIMEI